MAQWVLNASRLALAGLLVLVFGLTQSQAWGWTSPAVLASLVASLAAAGALTVVERRVPNPLMSFGLLKRHPNHLGATISQLIAGIGEMGLALLFPLLLILNLTMAPGLAGLALIPTTVPMVLIAPLAGRWYDQAGVRPPLMLGFGLLAISGIALALGVDQDSYLPILPGLVLFGIALALILTVNDPVTLDTVPPADQGQAPGVSATAEQFGGAIGSLGCISPLTPAISIGSSPASSTAGSRPSPRASRCDSRTRCSPRSRPGCAQSHLTPNSGVTSRWHDRPPITALSSRFSSSASLPSSGYCSWHGWSGNRQTWPNQLRSNQFSRAPELQPKQPGGSHRNHHAGPLGTVARASGVGAVRSGGGAARATVSRPRRGLAG